VSSKADFISWETLLATSIEAPTGLLCAGFMPPLEVYRGLCRRARHRLERGGALVTQEQLEEARSKLSEAELAFEEPVQRYLSVSCEFVRAQGVGDDDLELRLCEELDALGEGLGEEQEKQVNEEIALDIRFREWQKKRGQGT
jgi:hypothetical protein